MQISGGYYRPISITMMCKITIWRFNNMNKIMFLFSALGFVSSFYSVSFAADTLPVPGPKSQISFFDYKCRLQTCAPAGKPKMECWIEGSFCNDEINGADAAAGCCKNYDSPIRIKCNGFDLESKNSASQIDKDT